jgi:hypothetical protein
MLDEYAWRNPAAEQVCFLGDESMPDHEGTLEIPQLTDSSWNFSPLKFLCDGCIRYRPTRHNFVNQALRHYNDEGIRSAYICICT